MELLVWFLYFKNLVVLFLYGRVIWYIYIFIMSIYNFKIREKRSRFFF